MRKKLKIKYTDYVIGVQEASEKNINQSLRLYCNKSHKATLESLLKLANVFELRRCAFCNSEIKRFQFTFTVENDELELTGIRYNDELRYCKLPGCPGKLLNPNSVEFVSMTRDFTREQAIEYIHSRNASPFYRVNHADDESYRKHQNCFHRFDGDKRHEIVKKQNEGRSLQRYIDLYGEEGKVKWKLIQSKKGITVDNLSTIYDEQTAREIHQRWKNSCIPTLENFIRRHGETKGKEKYLLYVRRVTAKTRSHIKLDGFDFYSNYEVKFYQRLKDLQFKFPFLHDTHYEGSALRSDFYFPLINQHVELAFSYHRDGYDEKMELKRQAFSAIIIKSVEEFDIIIHDLIRRHEQQTSSAS